MSLTFLGLTFCNLDTASVLIRVVSRQGKKLKYRVSSRLYQTSLRLLTLFTVLLQAMKEDPPLDTKCRDKFLVQTVAVTADKEFSNVAQIVGGQAVPGIYVAILSLTSI